MTRHIVESGALDLMERAKRLHERASHEVKIIDSVFLEDFFSDLKEYDARWPLRHILFDDRSDLLGLVLDAGFPAESPIGFHKGTIMCEAALIGAPSCIELLASRGALVDAFNSGFGTPIELACAECGERLDHLPTVLALIGAGSALSLGQRALIRAARCSLIGMNPMEFQPIMALGLHALSSLGRNWTQIEARALRSGHHGSIVTEAAERLDVLQRALGHSDCEFFQSDEIPLADRLRTSLLPGDIESALLSLREWHVLAKHTTSTIAERTKHASI